MYDESYLRKQGKEGARTQNWTVPRGEVPKIVQRSLKQNLWAFEARSILHRSLQNIYFFRVINFCSMLRMVLVFSKDAKLFLLEHKALVCQRSVCLRVLWCWMKAGWAHRAWVVSVLSGHESLSTFSFTAVGCFIPLDQSWGGTLLPEEIAYKDSEVCLYLN